MEVFWLAAGIGVMFFLISAGAALLIWVDKNEEEL